MGHYFLGTHYDYIIYVTNHNKEYSVLDYCKKWLSNKSILIDLFKKARLKFSYDYIYINYVANYDMEYGRFSDGLLLKVTLRINYIMNKLIEKHSFPHE